MSRIKKTAESVGADPAAKSKGFANERRFSRRAAKSRQDKMHQLEFLALAQCDLLSEWPACCRLDQTAGNSCAVGSSSTMRERKPSGCSAGKSLALGPATAERRSRIGQGGGEKPYSAPLTTVEAPNDTGRRRTGKLKPKKTPAATKRDAQRRESGGAA